MGHKNTSLPTPGIADLNRTTGTTSCVEKIVELHQSLCTSSHILLHNLYLIFEIFIPIAVDRDFQWPGVDWCLSDRWNQLVSGELINLLPLNVFMFITKIDGCISHYGVKHQFPHPICDKPSSMFFGLHRNPSKHQGLKSQHIQIRDFFLTGVFKLRVSICLGPLL